MIEPLRPGATIGILGGGQLGRMITVAAARLGFRVQIFDPAPGGPAAQLAHQATCAAWDDLSALEAFGAEVDVITYEFENVPASVLDTLEPLAPVYPPRRALEVSQDRLDEKSFLAKLGLRVAPHAQIDGPGDMATAIEKVGLPAILKTRRFGYDGKGQARIASLGDAATALASLEGAPAILEGVVPFSTEISAIAARGRDGRLAIYDPGENRHEAGILRRTTVPAPLGIALTQAARDTAAQILRALDYVGVLGVEFFVTPEGLVVNEFAPRVHNSGHWTQNGCTVDQFEQHVRAIAGWPLGDASRFADVTMDNLIGDEVLRAAVLARDPRLALHLYGKAEPRPGRKMGHVNHVRPWRI